MIVVWINSVDYGHIRITGWLAGQYLARRKNCVHLQPNQERPSHMPRGPAKKPVVVSQSCHGTVSNGSVLLLKDALEHNWLTASDKPIRAFDAMCSTGVRIRRWRNEIPLDCNQDCG